MKLKKLGKKILINGAIFTLFGTLLASAFNYCIENRKSRLGHLELAQKAYTEIVISFNEEMQLYLTTCQAATGTPNYSQKQIETWKLNGKYPNNIDLKMQGEIAGLKYHLIEGGKSIREIEKAVSELLMIKKNFYEDFLPVYFFDDNELWTSAKYKYAILKFGFAFQNRLLELHAQIFGLTQ